VKDYFKYFHAARKWRKKTVLGGEGSWEFEVGEPSKNTGGLGLSVSSSRNVFFSRIVHLFDYHPADFFEV
jgi:hypothetical protein